MPGGRPAARKTLTGCCHDSLVWAAFLLSRSRLEVAASKREQNEREAGERLSCERCCGIGAGAEPAQCAHPARLSLQEHGDGDVTVSRPGKATPAGCRSRARRHRHCCSRHRTRSCGRTELGEIGEGRNQPVTPADCTAALGRRKGSARHSGEATSSLQKSRKCSLKGGRQGARHLFVTLISSGSPRRGDALPSIPHI